MKLVLTFLFVILTAVAVAAQDIKIKGGVYASAAEVKGLVPDNFGAEGTTYRPNIVGDLTGTVGVAGPVRFSAGAAYKRNFETDTDTYHLIGRASYHYKKFEPFIQFGAGIDRFSGTGVFSREITVGGDLNFDYFYIQPLAVGFKRTGDFLAPAERTFKTGFGIIIR